jgi:hypothetical protein
MQETIFHGVKRCVEESEKTVVDGRRELKTDIAFVVLESLSENHFGDFLDDDIRWKSFAERRKVFEGTAVNHRSLVFNKAFETWDCDEFCFTHSLCRRL